MIDIKVIVNGQQSNIVPKVYDSAQLQDNLEHSGGISLSWKSKTDGEIPMGSYVTYNGLRYILLDPYAPSKEGGPKNTRACYYKYDVQFKHPQGLLDKTPLWFDSRDAYGNPIELRTTSYTGYPYVIVKKVVDFMAEYANKMNDDFFAEAVGLTKDGNNKWQSTWTFNITAQVDQYGIPINKSAIISVGFDGASIKGAIDSIADKMGCNVYWDWANKEIIFVAGTTIDGESFNCFHVLGGTTNMGKATVSGGFAAVTQRLTLNETLYPGSIIDMRPNHSGIRLTKELILDNIYPKMDLYISYVHERTCRLTDEEGDFIVDHFEKDGVIVTPETEGAEPVYKTFAKWYVKLAYDKAGTQPYTFNQALLIDDKPLSLLFQLDYKNPNSMSKLVGRQFELTFFPEAKTEWDKTDVVDHDHAYEAPAGSFRVAFVAEGEIILPTTSAGGLCPQIGDKVTLVNMNLDAEKPRAMDELLSAAMEIIGLMQTPKGEYSETVIFGDEDPTTHEVPAPRIPRLMVGDATPFGNEHGPIVSAINLNLDTDVAEVTVSSWTRKTRSGGTADKVETVTVSANISTQGGNNYSNGSIGDGSYGGGSDSQTTYNNATLKPDSLFIASLNNVVDSISCDANGKVKQNTDIITKITCNYGTKDITSVCNLSYTEDWPYTVDGEETKRITAFLEDTPVYEEGVTHSTPLTVPNRTYDLSETKRYIRINFPQGFDMAHFDGKLPFAFTIGHPYFTDRAVGITVEALVPGVSSYKSTMFVRMDNTPTKPADDKGSYAVPSPTDCLAGQNSDGQNVYWSDGIPAGENKLWATTRIFSNTGVSPQQSSWSDPRQMTDTDTYDVEFAKMQTNDAKPADPTDANRHGGSGTQIWYDPTLDSSEDFTQMYWRAEREKKNGVWGSWTVIRIKGERGNDGGNTATVMLYRRGKKGMSYQRPQTTTYYKFSAKKLYKDAACTQEATSSDINGWSMSVPVSAANEVVYVTMAIAFSTTDVDNIGSNEWVLPVQFTENGINTATVFLYKRSASAITAHGISTSLYYKFADGKLYTTSACTTEATTQLNGWSPTMPTSDGNPCYIVQAAALNTLEYDEIETTDWSSVRKMVEDGKRGDFKSTVFKRTNTKPVAAPTGGSYDSPVPSGWSDGVPDGDAILWASACTFHGDGTSSGWSTPKQMTDTADFDVEFSSVANPNAPSGHPNTNTQWSDTADSTTIWMATSEYHNGVWSAWQVSKIKGEKGDSITKASETPYYIKNTTGVRPAENDPNWSTTKPTLSKGEWLFTKIVISWSDGSTTILYTDERNPNDGISGQDIIIDGATVMKYYVSTSNTTHPADNSSDWKDLSQVTQEQGKWLWSQATTYYRKADSAAGSHDAGKSINYNVSYISKDGLNGRGIKTITEYYQATNSSTSRQKPTSTSGWSTDPNLSDLTDKWDANHKYLWNMEQTIYTNSNGTETTDYTIPQILAIWTKDGAAGKGIDSVQNYYKITNTLTPPSRNESGWYDDPVTPNASEPYLWNYEAITWVNPASTTYTDVQMIGHYGRDGISVRAQYSADGTNWHNTFASGDIWMRTSTDGGTTWSTAMKIVGENGEETDFTFNISKNPTSTDADTPPTQCYYDTWQDAPMAVTSVYPYLWSKVVHYDSSRTVLSTKYIRLTGENGTSPWIADLDNQMNSVACDAEGKPVQVGGNNQSVSTNIKLFYGSTQEDFYVSGTPAAMAGVTIKAVPNTSDTAAKTGSLTVTYEGDPTKTRATINGKDEFTVTLTSKKDNTVTRNLTLIVNGIKPGPDGKTPSIYNLLPSVSEIVAGRTGEASDIEFVPTSVATDMWDGGIGGGTGGSSGGTGEISDLDFVPVSVATNMWDNYSFNTNG